MKIGTMNYPARNPLEKIDRYGRHGFDFMDFTLEPPAADSDQIDPSAVRAAPASASSVTTAYYLPIGSPIAGS